VEEFTYVPKRTSQDKFIYASSEHFAIERDFWRVACLASLVLFFEEFRSSAFLMLDIVW